MSKTKIIGQKGGTKDGPSQAIIDSMAQLISSELKTACIDFQANADTIQWTNGYGKAAHVTRLLGVNVDHVLVSYGSVLKEQQALGEQDFTIDDGEVLTISIVRTAEAQDASLTMAFGLVAEET